ncbi:MAG: hypothetical protein MZV70_20215 [Desulfobacterales bacterium]|nr:hypothetical protein [Desulfobacterales bacterium]
MNDSKATNVDAVLRALDCFAAAGGPDHGRFGQGRQLRPAARPPSAGAPRPSLLVGRPATPSGAALGGLVPDACQAPTHGGGGEGGRRADGYAATWCCSPRLRQLRHVSELSSARGRGLPAGGPAA